MAQSVRGIQDAGIIACAKHFIGNEQEHFRQVGEGRMYGYTIDETLSSNIDDVTMHELYLWYVLDVPAPAAAAAAPPKMGRAHAR